MGNLIKVNSKVKIYRAVVANLDAAATKSLEQAAEALHTEVVQAQIMPRRDGHLQNEKTFVDTSQSAQGRVSLVSEGPYARRLYYHPEYHFRKTENPNAQGKWLEPWISGEHKGWAQDAYAKLFKKNGGL